MIKHTWQINKTKLYSNNIKHSELTLFPSENGQPHVYFWVKPMEPDAKELRPQDSFSFEEHFLNFCQKLIIFQMPYCSTGGTSSASVP